MRPSVKLAIPIVLSVICLILSGSIIIAGYLVPATQNQGYTARICSCGRSYINKQPINQVIPKRQITGKEQVAREEYIGTVDLTYKGPQTTLTDNVDILTGQSYEIVKTYLTINFKPNSTVICYVSPSTNSIVVHLLSSTVALGFCAAFGILAVIFFLMAITCGCYNKHHKRSNYVEMAHKRRGDDIDILRN